MRERKREKVTHAQFLSQIPQRRGGVRGSHPGGRPVDARCGPGHRKTVTLELAPKGRALSEARRTRPGMRAR